MFYLSKNCLLYLTKTQETKYEDMKLEETKWPVAVVNEKNNTAMIKFIGQMRTKAIDLADLISEISA
jgi:hypothetical protein